MPEGGKIRKDDLAREVCTNQDMAEVENVRLGAKGLCFVNVAGVERFLFENIEPICISISAP